MVLFCFFLPKILYTRDKQSVSRCCMKLHIVVMPQRGLFQGFGTQGPDWKKKIKGKESSAMDLDPP